MDGWGANSAGAVGRRRGASLLAVLATLLAALALAPAFALAQRGHTFSFSFGSEGRATGQFQHPGAVAVNNTTGYVYVADRNNNRVEIFRPVLNGAGETMDEKFVGEIAVAYPVQVAVDNSTEASDPSKGDVYVVGASREEKKEPEPEGFWVYKYNSTGSTRIATFKGIKTKTFEEEFEELRGVAVDTHGSLLVYQGEEIYRFNNAAKKNEGVSHMRSGAGETQWGLAVDSTGDIYAGTEEPEEAISEFETELVEQFAEEGKEAGLFKEFDVIAKLDGASGKVKRATLDPEYTSAVAVNPIDEPATGVSELDEVYLANVASIGGRPESTVAAFSSEGTPIERFAAPGMQYADGVAVDSSTGEVFVSDGEADTVDVFKLEAPGPPTLSGLSACVLSAGAGCPAAASGTTTLIAHVDPRGADTHYAFEYGPGSCSALPPTCTKTTETDVGESFEDRAASVELEGLAIGTYHYRIMASNQYATVRSAERTFTVLAPSGLLPDGRAWELVSPAIKHGGEPEAMNRAGGIVQSSESGSALTYIATGPIGSEPEGNRNPEPAQILSTRDAQGWSSQNITTANTSARGLIVGRAGAEFQAFSPTLGLALVEPFPGPTSALAEPPLSPPLSEAERGKQEQTIYLRDDGPEALLKPTAAETASYSQARENGEKITPRNAGFLALVSELNAPGGEPFGGPVGPTGNSGLEFSIAATPDLSHLLFYSKRAAPGIYEWGPPGSCSGAPRCAGGDVQPVSVLPEGALATELPRVGGARGATVRHAISDNGTLVLWSTAAGTVHHLYVRDTATQETLRLDTPQPGASGAGGLNPQFKTASVSGSRVFFTDTQRLTADAKSLTVPKPLPDLYVAELSGGGAPGIPLTFTLKDLTPEGINGESADIQEQLYEGGGVLGASADGSTVYFVANGALAPGASRGHCSPEEEERPKGTTCNLYVRSYSGGEWTATKLVAALSNEDTPTWDGTGITGALNFMTSQLTPSGRYLAFMSNRSLTGYDNEDKTSEHPGERLDEEVFLYDLSSEHLVCASCNPTGERPAGVIDGGAEGEGAEGTALVADGVEIWSPNYSELVDHWLAGDIPGWTPIGQGQANYQSRYLSDNGRLFFNSPDHLVPAATGTKMKVFEYEPDGVGGCASGPGCIGAISSPSAESETAFLDASASGNDVFFLTAAQLVGQDTDSSFDVYDAHVCEAAAPCLTPPAPPAPQCHTVAECRPGSYTSPAFEAPASASYSGPGNSASVEVLGFKASEPATTLTRAQQLAKALSSCLAKYKGQHATLLACEKQARSSYGPTNAQKLASALRTCKQKQNKAKRRACEAQARKRYQAKPAARRSSTGRRGRR